MKRDGQSQNGYAMAALLVAMGVMAVMMTVAMPVWRQTAQREKEEELVFRGKQYVRAIGLFERKYANVAPPTVDVLVTEHFLRKKYKDPITNGDFVPIPATAQNQQQQGLATTQGGRGSVQTPQGAPQATFGGLDTAARGGIIGVTSASTARSIRVYNGASRYSDWRFVYAPPTPAPGAGAPGTAQPGAAGGGGRGQGPQGGGLQGPNRGTAPGRGGQQQPPQRGNAPQGPQGPGTGRGGAPQAPVQTPFGRGR